MAGDVLVSERGFGWLKFPYSLEVVAFVERLVGAVTRGDPRRGSFLNGGVLLGLLGCRSMALWWCGHFMLWI